MIKNFTLSLIFISNLFFSQEILDSKLIETNTSGSSDPKGMVEFNNKILYSSASGESSYEGRNLFMYDPSDNKVNLVKKVNSSYLYPGITSRIYKLSNNTAMFLSKTGYYDNAQLWRTDGTESGTTKIFTFSTYFDDFTVSKVFKNRLIFSRDYYNDQNTYAIGEDGTEPVKLTSGNIISNIVQDVNYSYFFVKNGLDIKLVKTDGTLSGTEILSTNNFIYYTFYYNLQLTLDNNKLYYSISDSDYKYKLFAFDLLSKNNSVIFNSNTSTNAINSICGKLGNDLIYVINRKLYKITETDLEFVKDFPQEYNGNISSTSYALNNKLFFNTTDNKVLSLDSDLNLTQVDFENSNSVILKSLDDSGFLLAGLPSNATTSADMWLYNGGDKKFKILVSSDKSNFASIGDHIYFASQKAANDRELYKISKTNGAISLTQDANLKGSGDPRLFTNDESNNLIFLAKDDSQRYQFFVKKRNQESVTQLSNFTTTPTGEFNVYPIKNTIFSLGEHFYYANGSSFYRTTVNEGSSLQLAGPINDQIMSYKIIKNQLVYLTYNSSQYETKIWTVNNDWQAPILLKTYYSTTNNASNNENLDISVTDDNWAYFMVSNYDGSTNFLRTDGSLINTKIITTINKGQGRYLFLGLSDNKIFFTYNPFSGNFQDRFSYIDLSNNTNYDLITGNYYPNQSVMYKGKIYFDANGVLMTIDKTGVSVVKDFETNERLYFSACGGRLFMGKIGQGIFAYDGIGAPAEIKYNNTSMNNIYALYMRGQVCLKDTFFVNANPDLFRVEKNENTAKKYTLYYNNNKANYISEIGTDGEKLYFNYKTEENGYELFEVISELDLATSESIQGNGKSQIYLYPNPATDLIKIRNESAKKIDSFVIYDFSGKIILEGKYLGEDQNIDVSRMNRGVYMIEVKTSSGISYSHKFIKK